MECRVFERSRFDSMEIHTKTEPSTEWVMRTEERDLQCVTRSKETGSLLGICSICLRDLEEKDESPILI